MKLSIAYFYPCDASRSIERLRAFLDAIVTRGYHEFHFLDVDVYVEVPTEKKCAESNIAPALKKAVGAYMARADFNVHIRLFPCYRDRAPSKGKNFNFTRLAMSSALLNQSQHICFMHNAYDVGYRWIEATLGAVVDGRLFGKRIAETERLQRKGVAGVFGATEIRYPKTPFWTRMPKPRRKLLYPSRICGGFSLAVGGKSRSEAFPGRNALVMATDVARHLSGWMVFYPLSFFATEPCMVPESITDIDRLPERATRAGYVLMELLPYVNKVAEIGRYEATMGTYAGFYQYGKYCAACDKYRIDQGWDRPSLAEQTLSLFSLDEEVYRTHDLMRNLKSDGLFDNLYRPENLSGETVSPEVPLSADAAWTANARLMMENSYGQGDEAYQPAVRAAATAAFLGGYAAQLSGM